VGQRWGLRRRINEGIATKELTKTNPTHPLHLKGWVRQLIIINKVQHPHLHFLAHELQLIVHV
jgi:hypothetical protein